MTDAETPPGATPAQRIAASWEANAAPWTHVVRQRLIPSRAAGTDAAILTACRDAGVDGARVLDVGCGEGWLARALNALGGRVTGIDASTPLVQAAAALGGGTFLVASYGDLVANHATVPGPFDLIVCNFAILDDQAPALLRALRHRLAPGGTILVHTVHPWTAMGDGPYQDGWRTETFAAFAHPFPAEMPWYARTLERWIDDVRQAGLAVHALREPCHPDTHRPLSLLLALRAP